MTGQRPFEFEVDGERLVDRINSIEIRARGGPEYTLSMVVGPLDCSDWRADLILELYIEWTNVDRVLRIDVTDSSIGLGASHVHRGRMDELLEAAFSTMLKLPYWRQFSSVDLIVLSVPTDWRNSLLNPPTYRQRLRQSLFGKPVRKALYEVARWPVERIA